MRSIKAGSPTRGARFSFLEEQPPTEESLMMQMQQTFLTEPTYLTVREGYYLGAPLSGKGGGELKLLGFTDGALTEELPLTATEWHRLNHAPYLLWYTLHECTLAAGGTGSFMLLRGKRAVEAPFHCFKTAEATKGSV